jgi:hypothetical protein
MGNDMGMTMASRAEAPIRQPRVRRAAQRWTHTGRGAMARNEGANGAEAAHLGVYPAKP